MATSTFQPEIDIVDEFGLAQVSRILSLNPIPDSDNIETATVLGWSVVVKKGEFKLGDLGIYFSIGSIPDTKTKYTEFLKSKPLKTRKIRGQISQGLLVPLSILDEYGIDKSKVQEGDDMTKLLGVKKFVEKSEIKLYVNDLTYTSPFPEYIPKTNESRIQNCPRLLEKMKNVQVIITQKYDGTSTTYIYHKNIFEIGSRNFIVTKKTSWTGHYFEIASKYEIKKKLERMGRNIAIQGEIIGPTINNNRHKVSENEYYVFNMYDIDKKEYLMWEEVLSVSCSLGLKTVPVVYQGILTSGLSTINGLLEFADKQQYKPGVMAEGIVIKTNTTKSRISFKVISNNYLIQHKL